MRVAIFSDVHGNLTALEAVLEHIDQMEPDAVVFAGDLCLGGPRPAACVERVRERDIACIYGNTDKWIDGPPLLSEDLEEAKRRMYQQINDMAGWIQAQLSEADRAWLRELPFHRRISPTTNPRDDLFIVHANPKDVDQVIYPSESKQKEVWGEVKQPDEALRPLLKDLVVGVLAFGHLHVPNIRQWGDLTLANISSVSLPGDGDPRAKYGLLTWDEDGGWIVEHQYVAYDVDKEIEILSSVQPPGWQENEKRFREAS